MFTQILLALAASLQTAPQGPEFEVIYLANEGFLIRSEGEALYVDAFVEKPVKNVWALDPGVSQAMLKRQPPFDDISFALVSHAHEDHVQPSMARKFLVRNPEAVLATTKQVKESLREESDHFEAIRKRVKVFEPAPHTSTAYVRDDIAVEFLNLPHGGGMDEVSNLGFVITIGTAKILHVGDADTDPAIFEAYNLPDRDLDVAIVPHWFFIRKDGKRIVEELIDADHVIASHIAPGEWNIRQERLTTKYENVHVLSPMQMLRLNAKAVREEIPHPAGAPK